MILTSTHKHVYTSLRAHLTPCTPHFIHAHVTLCTPHSVHTSLLAHVTPCTRHSVHTSLRAHLTPCTPHSVHTSLRAHLISCTRHSVHASLRAHVTPCTCHSHAHTDIILPAWALPSGARPAVWLRSKEQSAGEWLCLQPYQYGWPHGLNTRSEHLRQHNHLN